MRKRLAILALSAVTALGVVGSAAGALGNADPSPNAPAGALCPGADLTCKMPSTANAGQVISLAPSAAPASHGIGWHVR